MKKRSLVLTGLVVSGLFLACSEPETWNPTGENIIQVKNQVDNGTYPFPPSSSSIVVAEGSSSSQVITPGSSSSAVITPGSSSSTATPVTSSSSEVTEPSSSSVVVVVPPSSSSEPESSSSEDPGESVDIPAQNDGSITLSTGNYTIQLDAACTNGVFACNGDGAQANITLNGTSKTDWYVSFQGVSSGASLEVKAASKCQCY